MENNFSWNLCDDFIAHEGRGHNENPPGRGSGRYPWGSGAKNGKRPIHEHGEKKHKHHSSNNSQEDADAKARKAAKAAGLDHGDNWKMYRMAQAGDERAKRIIEEWEGKSAKNNGEKKSLEGTLNSDFNMPKNIYKKNILGQKTDELTKEGEQFKREIATRADAYYKLMDDKNFNERLENYKERKEALSKMNGKESVEDRRKYYDLDNKHFEYLVDDYNRATNNKFVGNPNDADEVAFTAFAEKYYEKMSGGSVKHSDMDREDFIMHTSLKRVLNRPISIYLGR